mgnify:CR=1 FL=1
MSQPEEEAGHRLKQRQITREKKKKEESRSRRRNRDTEKRRDRRRTPSPGRASAASNQDARIDRLQATVDALAAAVKDHVLPKTR